MVAKYWITNVNKNTIDSCYQGSSSVLLAINSSYLQYYIYNITFTILHLQYYIHNVNITITNATTNFIQSRLLIEGFQNIVTFKITNYLYNHISVVNLMFRALYT